MQTIINYFYGVPQESLTDSFTKIDSCLCKSDTIRIAEYEDNLKVQLNKISVHEALLSAREDELAELKLKLIEFQSKLTKRELDLNTRETGLDSKKASIDIMVAELHRREVYNDAYRDMLDIREQNIARNEQKAIQRSLPAINYHDDFRSLNDSDTQYNVPNMYLL
jgi:chromosome segregation ATPase